MAKWVSTVSSQKEGLVYDSHLAKEALRGSFICDKHVKAVLLGKMHTRKVTTKVTCFYNLINWNI